MIRLSSLADAPRRFQFALLPLLGWLAMRVQELGAWLRGLVFHRLRLEVRVLGRSAIRHLVRHSRRFHLGTRPLVAEVVHGLSGTNMRARALRLLELLGVHGCLFLYRERVPILAYLDDARGGEVFDAVVLLVPRGLLDVDAFLEEACADLVVDPEGGEAPAARLRIQVISGHHHDHPSGGGRRSRGPPEVGDSPLLQDRLVGDPVLATAAERFPVVPLEDLHLPTAQRRCLEDMEDWVRARAWYQQHRIPWRRGYLLHGPPGTGKTSFALALAQRFRLEVLKFDLTTFDNSTLRRYWSWYTREGAKLILLEDFDTIFEGRTNVVTEYRSSLNFGCLLGLLDGSQGDQGNVVVLTTNHPEVLDPALVAHQGGEYVGRPGRIDMTVHFDFLDRAGKRALAARLLPDRPDLVRELAAGEDRPTAASFQEACIQRILQLRAAAGRGERPAA